MSDAPSSRPEPRASGTLSGLTTLADNGASAPPTLAPGELFQQRYLIEEPLGEGGMGVVYRARDQLTGREVALKLLHPRLLANAAARQRFLREGAISRDLRHPNIVAVYDVDLAGEQAYLSMEYLPGRSLRQWLLAQRHAKHEVSLSAAVGISREILHGLSAAHAAQVIHRDLKPENILLLGDPEAGDSRLRILDFGIARALDSEVQLTVAGATLGTPTYMAPEQITGADTVGPAADLYAVAVMLYEMLLEIPPRGRWSLPSKIRPELPVALDQLLERALAEHPRLRFASADAFLEALAPLERPPQPLPDRPQPTPAPPEHPQPTPALPDPTLALASYQQRNWAGLVDGLIVSFVAMFVTIFAALPLGIDPSSNDPNTQSAVGTLFLVIFSLLCLVYFGFGHYRDGQTPGKKLFGIQVISADGSRPSLNQTLVRALGYLVTLASCGWGFWVMRKDPKGQSWHDRMAGTLVIRKRR